MRTRGYILYSLVLLAIFFTACNEERGGLAPVGTLRLSVDKNEQILTKATVGVTDELLKVCIVNANGDTVKQYNDFVKEVQNEKLVLPVGTYTVSVASNQPEEAGWEQPFYAGEETVEVKSGETTSATVVCKIANTKVTVVYSEGVKTNFVNYETTVSNSSGSLRYVRDETRAGYFVPQKLNANLALENKDGKKYTLNRVFPEIKPRYHYTITFSTGDGSKPENPEGGSDFGIEVDDAAKVVNCTVVIDESSLEGKAVPALKLSLSFVDNFLSIKDGDGLPASSLTINSLVGIEMLTVKAESDLFQAKDLDLFDLAHADDVTKAKLKELGFPLLEEKADAKKITLDFTDLNGNFLKDIAYQQSKKLHVFTVYAMDSLHQETEIKFTIEARPNVSIYVEDPNCWSTFAVLRGFCTDNSYFKLQTASGNIIDIKTISKDEEGNITALVIGLKPEVVYRYWLVSEDNPDMVCEPKEFTLNTPSVVPNLGFEEWGSRKGTVTGVPVLNTMSVTYVSPNLDSNTIYWDSGNMGAAAGSSTLTSAVDGDNVALEDSKKAAQLKSTWAGAVGIGAFAAGSIYSGQAKSVTADGATLQYGRPYQGFPTYLRGYYQYTPGIIDYLDSRCPGKNIVQGTTPDTCLIQIALSTKQFDVVSTKSSVIPYPKDDPAVFAYGEYVSGKTENLTGEPTGSSVLNGYEPFKVRLNYKSNLPPTGSFYILIVASACRYGDYFTGSTSSVMYVDEFELDYDYDAGAFSETELKSMKPVNINE